jgi:ketosteroid isomerase-like protein
MLPSNVSEYESTNPPPDKGGGPRLTGGLVVTVVLLVALVGVIAFAVTRLPVGAPARPTPVAAQATAAAAAPSAPGPATKPPSDSAPTAPTPVPTIVGASADAGTAQAIQDVIRKLDDAQAQAIATKNPQLMAPTATPEFYAEEVANNQDLVDSGVTEVQLLNIEWGAITVANDGQTANATAFETWTTTFDDGTTLQSRDRNVYTLIKDANGAWKVSADDHPDQPQIGQ